MGQGTDSCGGWESEYDEYEENLTTGTWITRDEGEIHVSKMTLKHLKGARRRCEMMAKTSNFTSDIWKWEDWVRIFDEEIHKRDLEPLKITKPEAIIPRREGQVQFKARGAKVKMLCFCGVAYDARIADLKRGWGLCCGKSCAAIRREFGRPAAKEFGSGLSVKQVLNKKAEGHIQG